MKLLAMRILKLTCINTITTWFFIFVITHRPTLILFPYTTLFRSHQQATTNQNVKKRPACSELRWAYCNHKATYFASYLTGGRSEERFSRNAETDLVCRLLLEKKNEKNRRCDVLNFIRNTATCLNR